MVKKKDRADNRCKKKCNNRTLFYQIGVYRFESLGFKKSIEIVNELAKEYNNDFCEWFKYDYRTITPKYHDAENPYWRIPENLDRLKHCPYCGKKIKVSPY